MSMQCLHPKFGINMSMQCIFKNLDRHPKSLVRLCICPPGPVHCMMSRTSVQQSEYECLAVIRILQTRSQTTPCLFGRLEDGSWLCGRCISSPQPNTHQLHDPSKSLHTHRVCSCTCCTPCYGLEDGTCQQLLDQAVFLHLESSKLPSCWMTAATKGQYSSTIDYHEVVKPLGGVLN